MMTFTKEISKKTLRVGSGILGKLSKHPVCKIINTPKGDEFRNGEDSIYINPENQFCFNYGYYTEEDLEDWIQGKGKIIKGKNKIEKKKYWDYAVFETDDKNYIVWMIRLYYNWFNKMETNFKPHGLIKKPLKIKNTKTKDQLENTKRAEEIIISMFAPYVQEIKKNLEYADWQNICHKYNQEFYGIKRTLHCLGVGYFGACNTPQEIENLSWVTDIVYAKAYYLYLKEKGVNLPDFEWLTNRSYHGTN